MELKYVPDNIENINDFYNYKESVIDVTPKTDLEFNHLLDVLKSNIINEKSKNSHKRKLSDKGISIYNPSLFLYENRVIEIENYLKLLVDGTDRKELIKKHLDSINLDKIDTSKIDKNILWSNEVYNLEILKTTNQIIQNVDIDLLIDKSNFKEVEIYLLALETLKFKNYLNKLYTSFESIVSNDLKTISNIIESKKEEMYISILSFNIQTQNYIDYVKEFTQKESLIDNLQLEYEISMYKHFKEVAHYVFNGKDHKSNLPDEYYNELELESDFFEGLNPKIIYDNCFKIVEFLEQKSNIRNSNIALNSIPQPNHNLNTSIDFFNSVNKSLTTELDIINFIEKTTGNEKTKLEILLKDIENFETDFIAEEVVESFFSSIAYNPKSTSELFKRFKEIVTNKINEFNILPTDSIFIDVKSFDCFENYVKLHIIEPYSDYSFLFQMLKHYKLIKTMKHLEFMIWLYDNNYIKENTKELLISFGCFKSKSKSFATFRQNNFNNIFNP